MKKLFALCLTVVLMLTCLTACDTVDSIFGGKSGVGKEYYENCAVFTFDDFESRICITLDRTGLDEGAIYYQVNLEEGALSIKYKESGLININNEQPLGEFTADDEMPVGGSGGYVEGKKIILIFESFSNVRGEIIIAFTQTALNAVYNELQLHQHEYYYETIEDAHKKVYTCECDWLEERDFEPHYDDDNDGECDECEYFVGISHEDHNWGYDVNETSHRQIFACGCESPENYEAHYNYDGDNLCDACGYEMSVNKETCNHQWDDGVEVEGGTGAYLMEYTCTICGEKEQQIITVIPPEGNHFLRNQAGAEWLREISADDVAEIKMISGGGGPLPPISFTYISSSRDKAVVSSIFEEYYWLDSKPVSEEFTQIPDGGYFIVQFVLNNGEVKQLYFINGDFYYDGNGNYFELVRLPVFRDGTNFVNHYGFERQYNPCPIHLIDGTPVCEIPLSEFEFIELRDDIYLDNELPTHYLAINGERVYFIKGEYFYIGDDRSVYYQLLGNLDELIAEYNK